MRDWDAHRVAGASGATLLRAPSGPGPPAGPLRAGIDSRSLAPGELFVGLSGERVDGGSYAGAALRAGAWGVLVAPAHAHALLDAGGDGAVLAHEHPLSALQALAHAWRRELRAGGAKLVAITGSTGKTSTKDILAALLGPQRRTVASPENFNTEIGLPLALLGAPGDTEALVVEMAMRGPGQIAELVAIAEPDVGVIVNVGPAHLELLGSLQAIAAAKAELIAGMAAGATAVVPVSEPLLEGHLRADLETITFGVGGDVSVQERLGDGGVVIVDRGQSMIVYPSFTAAHQVSNLLAAVAAARALGVTPQGALEVRFAALRGERVELPGGVILIDDCYNANPMSMRAAIDELAETAPARRVAVLGDMLELGPDAPGYHREIGSYAGERGVELLVAVGPLAAEMCTTFSGEAHAVADASAAAALMGALLRDHDTVLVKGSRGVGLERVAEALAHATAEREPERLVSAPAEGRGRR